ncbi:aldose epimerase [Streptacidiphilus pinicola]|uniref:Aldose epimerase n=1 Tax=Streptacidiphilus pinicola TaxID=2219663 RepID=A0A2X0KFD8_9ACTN|nr:aldose 1-epimerase family protein [Streptacidiphilus pinicola]RAG85560.1 aldose epimerase [Streptacidiphilus pinicola]
MTEYLTGRQHQLRSGDQTAVVVELGGALRDYRVGGRPVIAGFGADETIEGGRGQLLAPWPNRVRGGAYRWDGEQLQLPLSETEHGNAIHGLMRWVSWEMLEAAEDRVVLGATLWPQPGYPFLLELAAAYALTADGLDVEITTRNAGSRAAPYGVGQHPYLTVGTELVDDVLLTVPAGRWLRTDERGIPSATESVEGSPYDFRTAQRIADRHLDTAFSGLEPDATGWSVVRLAHPAGLRGVDVRIGEGAGFVQVYSGDTLAEPARRQALAVEPMTCPANAFQSGDALVTLRSGDQHTLRWGLSPWGTWASETS